MCIVVSYVVPFLSYDRVFSKKKTQLHIFSQEKIICNGAELGGAIGAMAPLVFWSRSIKKSRKVSKSKSRSLEWHQLFLPLFGANAYIVSVLFWIT